MIKLNNNELCNSAKKKKKTLIYLISGILVIAGIGTITYFLWPKKETKTEIKIHNKEEIKQLKTELSSLKSKLNNLSDNTQKTQLENKLTEIENQIKNLSENPNKSTLKNLEQEIKKIKKTIEAGKDKPNQDNPDRNDNPDEDPEPTDKKKGKFKYGGDALKKSGYSKFEGQVGGKPYLFFISKNHPRIKSLLSEGKLQKDKEFTIRYGKEDSGAGFAFNFDENNQELEIIEVGNPGPKPNPNPQPDNNFKNKVINYVATKINDNTYKYTFNTVDTADKSKEELTFKYAIDFLEWKYNMFFNTFQRALKDANSKFPGYFWKCPPVSKNTLDKPFEFVVIRSNSFNNIPQTPFRFQEHFGKSRDNQAVSFFSPSGNCLICPVPKGTADYINISQFTKNAPDEQQQALWKEVADSLMKELKKDANAPRWLNTEGTGIYYLHVRIDKKNGFYSNYPEYAKWE